MFLNMVGFLSIHLFLIPQEECPSRLSYTIHKAGQNGHNSDNTKLFIKISISILYVSASTRVQHGHKANTNGYKLAKFTHCAIDTKFYPVRKSV